MKRIEFKNIYLILGVLVLSATLRLYTLSKLMVFTPDESYLIYIAQTLVKDFHIIWIGVSALGLDFYMGPFWIYFIYPFVGVFNGDPLVLGLITSVLGIGTTILLYIVGLRIFNRRVGIIASLLYATSALMVFYDQQPYPPGVPLLSLSMFYCIWMSRYSNKWWILFSILYGLVFHIHLSLFLIIFVAAYWAFKQRKLFDTRTVVLSILAFLVAISPLIAFDYFHRASNVTVVFRIVESIGKSKSGVSFVTRATNLTQSFGRLFYLIPGREAADEILYPCIINSLSTTTKINIFLSAFVFLVFMWFFVQNKFWEEDRTKFVFVFSLAFLFPFLFLSIFNPIEYYLLGMFPIIFLVTAVFVDSFKKPFSYFLYLLLFIVTMHGIYTVVNARGSFGIESKKALVESVMNVIGESPYELLESGECHGYGGFRYLFKAYGRMPIKSSEDSNFTWLWPDELTNISPEYLVATTETRAKKKVRSGYEKLIEVGGYKAFIYSLK